MTRIEQPEGGWYAAPLALLERYGVLVQPGYYYDFEREAFLVVSLLPVPEVLDAGVARVGESVLAG